MNREIKVISSSSKIEFTEKVNQLLKQGWEISSTNCGFLNSESYGFQDVYQAVILSPKKGLI